MDYGIRSPQGQIWSCDSLETARENVDEAPHMEIVAREAGGEWKTIPASPIVWVLSTGVYQEPGAILGIYTERNLAIGDLVTNAHQLTTDFPLTDTSGEREDGTLELFAGGNWLALEPHPLITATQLT